MISAAIGDIIGSRFEFLQATQIQIPEKENLWDGKCSYTDDTVLTAAVARWLLDGNDLADHLHQLGNQHLHRGYGGNFVQWLLSHPVPGPYGSWGNGAAMRVSPVAFWANSEEELMALAEQSANPTHNHPQGIRGAQVAAWAMSRAFAGLSPQEWMSAVEARFGYPLSSFSEEAVRRRGMELECETSVLTAIWCAGQGPDFQGVMQQVISLGGDTDTVAAIAGPMAEGLYGLPEGWVEQAAGYFSNGDGVWETFQRFYHHPRVQARYEKWNRSVLTLPDLPPLKISSHQSNQVDDPFTRFFQNRDSQ